MKKFCLGVLSLLGKLFPYFVIALAFLLFVGTERKLSYDIQSVKAQLEEMEANQENEYAATLTIETALANADVQMAMSIDKLKSDTAKENGVLLKTIYNVDKNSNARDQGIVDGVNGLVKDVSYALQKPSYNYLKNITVKIISKAKDADQEPKGKKGWMGTGVVIAITKDYTYILTNRHVMGQWGDGTHNYYVKEGTNKYTITAIKISKDEAVDLALIRIKGQIDGKVAVIGFGEVKPQDAVYMVGMNLGRPFFYSEGTVSGFDPEENDELVVGMPVGPGNSGSAVINKDGLLVGLLYAGSIIDEDDMNEMDIAHGLCVPIKAIRLFLAGYIE